MKYRLFLEGPVCASPRPAAANRGHHRMTRGNIASLNRQRNFHPLSPQVARNSCNSSVSARYNVRMEYSEGRHIGDILKERNIELATNDPVARGGFTQVPNFILRDGTLSLGAKVAYSMFLHFAWNNDSCFRS